MIEVKIIEDSISPLGKRLTTFQLKMPRIVLAEFNTHRMFSRNSSSSRAIPIKKMLLNVLKEPFYPVYWGENKNGMQAHNELSGIKLKLAKFIWKISTLSSVFFSYNLHLLGVHKQIGNRLLEYGGWSNTIVTATEWDNFWELRCHKDAQPEIQKLANKMKHEYDNSVPQNISFGDWHLPYIKKEEYNENVIGDLLKMSTARCARVSYLTHEGKSPNKENDLKLYEKLIISTPVHASPTEHQATPLNIKSMCKNFDSWVMYRYYIENNLTNIL